MTKLTTHESAEILREFIVDLQKACNGEADGLSDPKAPNDVIDAFAKQHKLNNKTVGLLKAGAKLAIEQHEEGQDVTLEEITGILSSAAESLGQKKLENGAQETLSEARDIFKKVDAQDGEQYDMHENHGEYETSLAFWIDHVYEKSQPPVTIAANSEMPVYSDVVIDAMKQFLDNGEVDIPGHPVTLTEGDRDQIEEKLGLERGSFYEVLENVEKSNFTGEVSVSMSAPLAPMN